MYVYVDSLNHNIQGLGRYLTPVATYLVDQHDALPDQEDRASSRREQPRFMFGSHKESSLMHRPSSIGIDKGYDYLGRSLRT
jgi:hypothetical protein